ncbi:MAG TPA: ATP-binding protein [Patescibacteria group bacterium]|nr:ATP-binding protein [Patescibacteria group bacterium]
MILDEIRRQIVSGESEVLELKKSTGQLTRAGETLCAFLNAAGGRVMIGITPEGRIAGQQVTDKTQQDIANVLRGFEPATQVLVSQAALPESDRVVLILEACPVPEARPYCFEGRPYYRSGTTTAAMPQARCISRCC